MHEIKFIIFGFLLIQTLTHYLGGAEDTTSAASAPAPSPSIVTKEDWNGAEATGELDKLTLPVQRIIICHTATSECNNASSCKQQLLNIQNFHMQSLRFYDISYNFLIGGDGNVYEGRGWSYLPAVARGYNNGSLAVGFIGTYHKSLPNKDAIDAAKELLQLGVDSEMIDANYYLYGHRQFTPTESPGDLLYAEIKQWPNWSRIVNIKRNH